MRTLAVVSAAFFVTLGAISILSPVTPSNAAETTITADVSHAAYSLTLSVNPNVTLNLDPSPTGAMTVGYTTVTTNTNSPSGYKLYLGMNSTNNDLIHSTNSNLKISSVSGAFDDATALSSSATWGYAISSTASTVAEDNDFDASYTTGSNLTPNSNKFAAVPVSTNPPQLIAETTHSNTGGVADNLDIYYGVIADYTTPTGSYSNTVKYTAIADYGQSHGLYVTPEEVQYNKVTSMNIVTTLYTTASTIDYTTYLLTPAELTAVHNNTPVSTYSSKALTCTRDTNATSLTMWCDSITQPAGDYYIYIDIPYYGESYEGKVKYVSLDFFNISTMQQMTPEICNAATTPIANAQYEDKTGAYHGNTNYVPTRTLTDTRDGNTYTIRKLADGNCWMTENLRLGDSTKTMTLTSSDTDTTTDFILPIAQTSGSDAWSDWNNSTNTKHVYATGNTDYGNYYNWYTATAGTGLGTMSSASATNLTNATSSICPKGWRLPDGGQSPKKSFYALDIAYGGDGSNRTDATQRDKFVSNQLNFPYSGHYNSGSGVISQGFGGHLWSRSANTTDGTAYNFYISSDNSFRPQYSNGVGDGFPVRCVNN